MGWYLGFLGPLMAALTRGANLFSKEENKILQIPILKDNYIHCTFEGLFLWYFEFMMFLFLCMYCIEFQWLGCTNLFSKEENKVLKFSILKYIAFLGFFCDFVNFLMFFFLIYLLLHCIGFEWLGGANFKTEDKSLQLPRIWTDLFLIYWPCWIDKRVLCTKFQWQQGITDCTE